MPRLTQYTPVMLLLLLMFGLRGYQPELQVPYVDEGFHLRRALKIYDFEENPARESHGKLLLYFWLGLFDTDNPRTMLPIGRLSIALISMITGAGLYRLGRLFANHRAGVIALTVYSVMPLALFYERMAMADPLASGLMGLVIWRSYVFARRPSTRQGATVGLFIALATLAKLSMILAVLFPLIAVLIFGRKKRGLMQNLHIYLPPLVLSGVVFCLIWSPFALPALLARNSNDPFVLVNARNIERTENDPASIAMYVELLMPALGNFMLDDMTIRDFGIAGRTIKLPDSLRFHVIWLIIGLWFLTLPLNLRNHLYIGCWFVAMTILLVSISSYVSSRYFMPVAAPLALMIGLLLSPNSSSSMSPIKQLYYRFYRYFRWVIATFFVGWIVIWAIPFINLTLTAPDQLPFNSTNWLEYHSGILTADHAVSTTARLVNEMETDETILASWNLCHRIFFTIEQEITCIPIEDAQGRLSRAVQSLEHGDTLILLISGYPAFYEAWDYLSYDILAENDHDILSRPIRIIRMQYTPQNREDE